MALPDELLRRHLVLVAKTGRGKSALLTRIADYLLGEPPTGARPPLLLLVDPHRDLAEAVLGLVPPARRDDVVYLNVAERERPFGLNLLDTGLGWDRDKAVENALTIFQRAFDRFWGPRMEDTFRHALLTLWEANEVLVAADSNARARQHTLLDVPVILTDPVVLQGVLAQVADPVTRSWWSRYYARLDRRFQIEVINPVQTKIQRFSGSRIARGIIGQPASTIDPKAWLETGAIVIVNTAKGLVGEATAALIGGTVINLVAQVVAEQAARPRAERRRVVFLVDEFQSLPGADYELILGELRKYGANLILATQSLARLAALDAEHTRALRPTVFASLDGLFAFQTSAEDARYLVPELGDELDEQDLVELGEHQCYVRISAGGERLPVFSVRLDPPPADDPVLREKLAVASARRYGRDRAAVEETIRTALGQAEMIEPAATDEVPVEPAAAADADRADRGSRRRSRSKSVKQKMIRPPSDGTSAGTESGGTPAEELEAGE